ncbi:protein deacetylase HDAC6-like [Babylonia areolata]|uniref:protein deacetylase HDAC6-like n=1 Tax=Babylonia areolata TaxID=304850 RepID=UPI003FCF579D
MDGHCSDDDKTGGADKAASDKGNTTPATSDAGDYNPLKDFCMDVEVKEPWRDKMRHTLEEMGGQDVMSGMSKSVVYMNITEDGPVQHNGTGFIYDELFTRHKCEWDSGYPECPERVSQPVARCQELGLVERCVQIPVKRATEDQVRWKHAANHVELAKETATMTPQQRLELAKKYDSWYCNESTYECCMTAAGSCIELMDHVLQKKVTNGFAMVRPPGHHAMHDEFCGYCVFNNAALAATHALNHGMERILIVDWDVHHGQGTQYMFYDDPRVMYFSIHRYEHGKFWPHLRESDYDFIGEGKGKGHNVNVPLNQTGLGDADYMAIMQQLLMPLAYEFNPQVVLISCGLDSAIGDEKGEMMVSPAAYAHFIHMLSALCEGRLCTLLEGGYCLQSLSEGCALTLRSLLGDPCPQLPPMSEPSDSVISSIVNVIKVLRPYWRCFDTFQTFDGGEQCMLQDINLTPPRETVEFVTADNRPPEYDVMGHFPRQSPDTIAKNRARIDRLIAETSLSKAPHRTCFVFDTAMNKHKNLHDVAKLKIDARAITHPERPKRTSSIFEKHREWGLLKRCLQVEARRATEDEILRVHDESYLEIVKGTADMSEEDAFRTPAEHKYMSVYMCRDTYDSALLSAGGVLQATEAVLTGQTQNAVAVIRPPGHHAESDHAMGFCIFNNVAVAARHAQDKFGVQRVLIVDWDVHHGNATQHTFYSDPSVLYISVHRFGADFFPFGPDGDLHFTGRGKGQGFNVNVPWLDKKMGNAEYMAAFQRIVMPIAYEFAPELVLVSAGFDAAEGDLLGMCSVLPECFGHLTHMLCSLANGRVVLVLEGGYDLTSLSLSMATCTSVLLGDPCPPLQCGAPNNSARRTLQKVLEVQRQFWKSLKFAVGIPSAGSESALGGSCGNSSGDPGKTPEGGPVPAHPGMQSGDGKPDQAAADPGDAQKETAAEAGPSSSSGSGGGGLREEEEEMLGACGGSWRPNTVEDVLRMQGVEQLYAVQPRPWCPHVPSVRPLPPGGLDTRLPCEDCGDSKENWVCLTCYKVFCSRYVNEHMLFHSVAEEHLMVLSYSDLSVWCYACNDYIDNEVCTRYSFTFLKRRHCGGTNPYMLHHTC